MDHPGSPGLPGLHELLDSVRQASGEERETLVTRASAVLQRALASHPETPEAALVLLAASPDALTAGAALHHVAISGEMERDSTPEVMASLVSLGSPDEWRRLRELAGDLPLPPALASDDLPPDRLQAAIDNPVTPPAWRDDLMGRLATEEASALRRWVAEHPRAPRSVLEILSGDANPAVRLAALRPGMEPLLEAIEALAREAMDPATSTDRLVVLAREPWSEVQRLVAEHPAVAPATLGELAGHPHREVRLAVVEHPSVPGDALASLAHDPEVRSRVAAHPRTPARVLHEMGTGRHANHRDSVDAVLAANPRTPPDTLRRLLARSGETPDGAVRRLICLHPATPPDMLQMLARSSTLEHPREILDHPSTPVAIRQEILERLARSSLVEQRMFAALGPQAGPALHWKLARDPERAVRAAALANPLCPPELLEEVARVEGGTRDAGALVEACRRGGAMTSPYWQARDLPFLSSAEPTLAAVAGNPRCPVAALEHMGDETFITRLSEAWRSGFAGGAHDEFLAEVAPGLILSREWMLEMLRHVRLALARNPGAPEGLRRRLLDELAWSQDERIRLAVAGAPELPGSRRRRLLEDLAGSRDPSLRFAAATSPDFPSEHRDALLERLADIGPEESPLGGGWKSVSHELSLGLAAFPGAPEDVLRKLARSPEVRVRIETARHPALPADIRAALLADSSAEVREAIRARPDAPPEGSGPPLSGWLWQSRPEPEDNSPMAREQRYRDVMCLTDSRELVRHARHPDPRQRYSVARNPAAPPEALDALTGDPIEWVRHAVATNPAATRLQLEALLARGLPPSELAAHPAAPIPVLELASRSLEDSVRRQVAGNPSTPPSLLATLAQDASREVVEALAANPAAPEELLLALLLEQRLSRLWVLYRNPGLAPSFLETLDRLGHPREILLQHPNLDGPRLDRMASDALPAVRRKVAEHARAPEGTLARLAQDLDPEVRRTVARAPATSAGTLERLAADPHVPVRVQVAVHPTTEPGTLIRLAQDPDRTMRVSLASSPHIPPAAALALARDLDPEVRAGVARHPSLTLEDLYWLAAEEGSRAMLALAQRRDLPPAASEVLVEARSREIDAHLLGHRALPAPLLETVAARLELGEKPSTWEWLARSPGAPWTALRILANDTRLRRILLADPATAAVALDAHFASADLLERVLALLHPAFPADVLARAVSSPCWPERWAASRNPSTPEAGIERLTRDAHRLVRAAARERRTGGNP